MDGRRRLRKAAGAAVLACVILSALSAPPVFGQDGKQVYGNRCALCHGAEGDGKGVIMQTAPFGPDFWKASDDVAVSRAIVEGKGRMPAIPLSPEETRAVVDYMKSTFKK